MVEPRRNWADDVSDEEADLPAPIQSSRSIPLSSEPAKVVLSPTRDQAPSHFIIANVSFKIKSEQELKFQLFGTTADVPGLELNLNFNRDGRSDGRASAVIRGEEALKKLLACDKKKVLGRVIQIVSGDAPTEGQRIRTRNNPREAPKPRMARGQQHQTAAKWLFPKGSTDLRNENRQYMRKDFPASSTKPVLEIKANLGLIEKPSLDPLLSKADPFSGATPIDTSKKGLEPAANPVKSAGKSLQEIDPSILEISPNKVTLGPVYIIRVRAR